MKWVWRINWFAVTYVDKVAVASGFRGTRREFLSCQQGKHIEYYYLAVFRGFYLFYAALARNGHCAGSR